MGIMTSKLRGRTARGAAAADLACMYIADISRSSLEIARKALASLDGVVEGGSWTTDALFRETEEAIEHLSANFRTNRIGPKEYWPLHNLLVVVVKMLNALLNR